LILADDTSLLLLPTAVGTSNDQKKQKSRLFITFGSLYSFEGKSSFPVSHFIHSCNAKTARISCGAIAIFSAFQHVYKTL